MTDTIGKDAVNVTALGDVVIAMCRSTGLDSTDHQLLRIAANAVFLLPQEQVVIRLSACPPHRATRTLAVARWLLNHGVPAVPPVLDVEQPVAAAAYTATFWHYLPQRAEPVSAASLAPLLRRLHDTDPPPFNLPAFDPIGRARERVDNASILDPPIRTFLRHRCTVLEQRLANARFTLPAGPIHGDAWTGNLLWAGDETVLSDFDDAAVGPREWDLIPTVVNTMRFGRPRCEYQNFLDSYGFDVTATESFGVLRDIRELVMLTGVLPALPTRPVIAAQFHHRLAGMRSGAPIAWTPYP